MNNEDITFLSVSDDNPDSIDLTSQIESAGDGSKVTLAAATPAAGPRAVLRENSLEVENPFAQWTSIASAHDVATLILGTLGTMTAMKLQKLVYYCQAWSLVWDEEPLFHEDIEAWANGPVVRELYQYHQGMFKVEGWFGDPRKLTASQKDSVQKVLEYYGRMSSQELSDLTHSELPWRKARVGLKPGERGCRVISHADMAEYYASL